MPARAGGRGWGGTGPRSGSRSPRTGQGPPPPLPWALKMLSKMTWRGFLSAHGTRKPWPNRCGLTIPGFRAIFEVRERSALVLVESPRTSLEDRPCKGGFSISWYHRAMRLLAATPPLPTPTPGIWGIGWSEPQYVAIPPRASSALQAYCTQVGPDARLQLVRIKWCVLRLVRINKHQTRNTGQVVRIETDQLSGTSRGEPLGQPRLCGPGRLVRHDRPQSTRTDHGAPNNTHRSNGPPWTHSTGPG